jgi:rare lipoprotein A
VNVRRRHLPVVFAVCLGCASAPAAAQQVDNSGTGGVEARPGTLQAPDAALVGRAVTLAGSIGPGGRRRKIAVERRVGDGKWQRIASATADRNGSFDVRWAPDAAGRFALRAGIVLTARRARRARSSQARELFGQLTVYDVEVASWYGPGFFGQMTACGFPLAEDMAGVAHKTLPCGTRVEFYYRGTTVEVPVIDRGPYVAGRSWDLTQVTPSASAVTGTARVGVLVR